MVITTRKFNMDIDAGFVIDTMPKAIYHDKNPRKRGRQSEEEKAKQSKWFTEFHENLTNAIKFADIIIATSDEEPDFILGYAMFIGDQLEFIFVKDDYRRQGVATMLSNQREYTKINEDHVTQLGRQILTQKSKKVAEDQADEPVAIKKSEQPTGDRLLALIESGFPVRYAAFQSAVLSGFNAAEQNLSMDSSNRQRVPESMHYTAFGLIVKQNNHTIIVPLSNVISVSEKGIKQADVIKNR